jgi:hypothetical protein
VVLKVVVVFPVLKIVDYKKFFVFIAHGNTPVVKLANSLFI